MKPKKNTHGGARAGAGRKTDEKRKPFTLKLRESVVAPFRKKHGREWGRELEDFMARDAGNKKPGHRDPASKD